MDTYQENSEPFTYLVGWSEHNLWYYGVRYAAGCKPEDLWSSYFTSSSYVKETRQIHGEPDVVQIRRTFKSKKKAIDWELKVLRRLNLHKNPNFLNKNCAGAIYYDEAVRNKIRTKALGNKRTLGYTNEYKLLNGMKLSTGKPKGSKHSEEAKHARSERLKGKPVHPNLKYSGGHKHSIESIEKIKIAASSRETFSCDSCNKSIKGKMNWDRHLKSSKHQSQLFCN